MKTNLVALLDEVVIQAGKLANHNNDPYQKLKRLLDQAQSDAEDAHRLQFIQDHLMRKATMRFEGPPIEFKDVNAWAISSEKTDLREALDAVMRAEKKGLP